MTDKILPPGRELDDSVAEFVMGECRHRRVERTTRTQYVTTGGFDGNGKYSERTRTFEECYPRCMDCGVDITVASLPPYSTDIAAAWQVVEKLRSEGWRMCIYANPDGPCSMRWCIDIHPPYQPTAAYSYNNDSMAYSICLAALKVKGVSIRANDPA